MPRRSASCGLRSRIRSALEQDFAGIRQVQAAEDFHQGGLAGTVLTHQGVDRAGLDIEWHPVQGLHPGKDFDKSRN